MGARLSTVGRAVLGGAGVFLVACGGETAGGLDPTSATGGSAGTIGVAGAGMSSGSGGVAGMMGAAGSPMSNRDDPRRHEPSEPIDQDNVVSYGAAGGGLTAIPNVPEPPKSGFRLVMQPQDIESGFESPTGFQDLTACQSWQIPDIKNRWIYSAMIHVTPGMHHATLYGVPINTEFPSQPYPHCTGSADGFVFGRMFSQLQGTDATPIVPKLLFASSTQVIGIEAERFSFAEGYAYEIPTGYQVMADVHLQNTTPEAVHVEAAWDFFTMPVDLVTNPAAMFVFVMFNFVLPPRAQTSLRATCNWAGGEVLAIQPHTHQWATGFETSFGSSPLTTYANMVSPEVTDTGDHVFTPSVSPYDRQGTGLTDSDIELYDPPIGTDGMNAVQFQCHFNNTTDHDMCFGVAQNEMCFLFGYVSPPEAQRFGVSFGNRAAPCLTFDGGDKPDNFSLPDWMAAVPAPARAEITAGATTCGLPGFF